MKYNLNKPLLDIDGEVIKVLAREPKKDEDVSTIPLVVFTIKDGLRQTFKSALVREDKEELKGDVFEIGLTVCNKSDEIELTSEEVTKVKAIVLKHSNALVSGRVNQLLEQKTT